MRLWWRGEQGAHHHRLGLGKPPSALPAALAGTFPAPPDHANR
jgi:hypothetical protein